MEVTKHFITYTTKKCVYIAPDNMFGGNGDRKITAGGVSRPLSEEACCGWFVFTNGENQK